MKNKILVIFLLSCIFSYIIYKTNYKDNNYILILGDNYLLNSDSKTYYEYLSNIYININKLLTSDRETYSGIISKIKNNYFIINKDEKIYLTQEISKSTHIIISANNYDYNNKCKKNKSVLNKYDNKINNDKEELIQLINKISTSQVIILNNYCDNNIEYNNDKENQINIRNLLLSNKNINKFSNNKLSKIGNYELFSIINSKINSK